MLDHLYTTLDWLAAGLARALGSGDQPRRLARPMVGVALLGGLAADAAGTTATGSSAIGYVAVALTLSGAGMLWLVVGRAGDHSGGGTRSAGGAVLDLWLRRLQAVFAALLAVVVCLVLAGALVGSSTLIVRNVAEVVRLAGAVLAISYALMDDDVGVPGWVGAHEPVDGYDPTG